MDNTTNYTLTQTENRSCKVAVEGKVGPDAPSMWNAHLFLPLQSHELLPNSCRVGSTPLLRLDWQVTWASCHSCPSQWNSTTMVYIPTYDIVFCSSSSYLLWEQFRASVQLKPVSSIPILSCEDFSCFLNEALHFAWRKTSTPLHMAQTRISVFTHSWHSFIIAASLLCHPTSTTRSSFFVVQSGLLIAESEPVLALVEAVCGLQIKHVFLPLTQTQEDREADGSLQPVHNGVADCFFKPPQKCPNWMLLVCL